MGRGSPTSHEKKEGYLEGYFEGFAEKRGVFGGVFQAFFQFFRGVLVGGLTQLKKMIEGKGTNNQKRKQQKYPARSMTVVSFL